MKMIKNFTTVALLSAGLLIAPLAASAQQPTNLTPAAARVGESNDTNFSNEQLLTSTVHQAWLLSGKDEGKFFDMVEKLAGISAANRGVTLPDSAAAGKRMGEYIKRTAKADTDQLLYAVVDKAVVMTTHAAAKPAGTKK